MDRKTGIHAEMIARPRGAEDEAAWSALGRRCGYTGRGDLAGFYGGRSPSMVRLPDGRRILTDAGHDRARRRGP